VAEQDDDVRDPLNDLGARAFEERAEQAGQAPALVSPRPVGIDDHRHAALSAVDANAVCDHLVVVGFVRIGVPPLDIDDDYRNFVGDGRCTGRVTLPHPAIDTVGQRPLFLQCFCAFADAPSMVAITLARARGRRRSPAAACPSA